MQPFLPVSGPTLARRRNSGSSLAASPRQSGAQMTSSSSHSSRFQGWAIVATRMPWSIARRRFSGLSSISSSMPSSTQRPTLSCEQYRSSIGNADLLEPARRGLVRGGVAMAGDVDEVTVLVPAPDRLDGVGVGLAGEDRRLAVRLLDAEVQLVVAQARDAPVQLLLVGQVDAEAAQGGGRQPIPVVMQRGVDVDGDAHASWRVVLPSSLDLPRRVAVGGSAWPVGRRDRRSRLDLDAVGRPARYVMAPIEALETSLAYLPRTPPRSALSSPP